MPTTGNVGTFLDNLKVLVEAVDVNVGKVFLSEERWTSAADLIDAGAVLEILSTGLWDTIEELGPATRFWILESATVVSPLSTCTDQWDTTVRVVGFFGYKENESQAVALRKAAEAILSSLGTKAAELTTLAAGMGGGYLGYLELRPSMSAPVRAAQLLGSLHQGHVCQISTGYSEEVARE